MMFQEHAFLDRFKAARDAGFDAVEFLFPYDHTPDELEKVVADNALEISVFNLFPGKLANVDSPLCRAERRNSGLRLPAHCLTPKL